VLATLIAGCAAPTLSRVPLIAHHSEATSATVAQTQGLGTDEAPAAIEVAERHNAPATTVVAYRPVAVEADRAEPASLEPQTVEPDFHGDPFAVSDEQSNVAETDKRDSSRRLLGQTLFRDPGMYAPFAVRSVWLDVQRDNPPVDSGTSEVPSLLASSEIAAGSPRAAGAIAAKSQRFTRALASTSDAWCRFRMSPQQSDPVLVARANYDDESEMWQSLGGGYSSPEICPECGERQCGCDDGNGCGIADFEGNCPCSRPRRLSFRQDMYDAIRIGKADFVDLLTVQNAVVLGVAGGAAAIIHNNGDPQVRDWTAEHPDRWGHATNFLGELGNPWVQGGLLTGIYAYGLWKQDDEIHELSLALVGAWKIAAVGTVGLKYIVRTDRPSDDHLHSVWEGGQYGFPSIEASTSFAMAAVFDSFYGLKAGIPAYMLAGLISWSRIDTRDSDVSDVVFGAVFGYVVGKSVAIHHIENAYGFKLQPYTHPTSGAPGISLNFAF
jgi:hypothetical protein